MSLELYRIEKASKAQQKYFILSQMSEVEGGTHLPSGMIIEGKLNLDKVKRCFQRIIDRHEALRTALCVDDKNQIIQKIYKHVTFDLKYAEYMIDDEQIPVVLKEQIYSFDMNQPPLMHVNITKIAEDKYLMLTDLFHGVSDGYSASIIAREFMQLYQGYLLPEVTQPYSEYIRFMDEFAKTDKYAAKKAYWSKQLPKSAYTVDLPTNYERPMINKMHGKTITRKIPSDKVLELKEFAKQSKCSFYMVLLGTFEIMISKLSKQSELYLGTPVSVREVGDFAGSLGLFTNTMLIHSNVDEDQTVREFLNPLKVDCAMGFVNAEFPFEDLVEQLKFTCPMNRNPLFDVMFVYENAEERVNHISNLVCTTVDLDMEIALYDLTFELVEENGMLSLNQYFNRDLFSQEAVEQWETLYLQILDDCMANPERTIDSIELIGYQAPIVTPKRPESICNSSISIEVEDAVDKNISDASIGDASIGDASIGDTNIGDENINNETISEENLMETIEDDRKKKQCQQVIQRINQVVEQITGIRGINVNANFFEVGIRSVHALKIVDRLYENYKITITDIFKYPTIYSLACFICDIDENTVSAVKKEETKDTKDKLKQEDIAIIGIDVRLPKSRNIKEYWENLNSNNECITFFTDEELLEAGVEKALLRNPNYVKAKGVLEDAEYFDSSFFDYSPNEADKMDPQIRILHESAWKVLEDAGYCPDTYDGAIGVFVGGASNYTWTSHIFKPSSDIGERVERISLNDKDFFSTRVSYKLNLKGPSYSIQTACSTSLAAVNLACESLLLGSSDMAIAGGVTVMLPQKTGYIYKDGMILSKDGHCRVFDRESSGTVFSDGVGLVVLKKLKNAIRDKDHIYAVIKSVAVNNDGNRKVSYTAPSIMGQAEVIKNACSKAKISPDTITYIESHGTGTVLGDPIEIEGLKMGYGASNKVGTCAIGALKANMGHLDAAAGVAGIVKVALAMQHKKIPGTINFDTLNPEIQLEESPFYINTDTISWRHLVDDKGKQIPLRAGISALGFGGTNAHAILEEAPEVNDRSVSDEHEDKLIVLSAKTESALNRMVKNLREYMLQQPEASLEEIEYTLQVGRKEFNYRTVFCVKTKEALLEELEEYLEETKTPYNAKQRDRVVFMFSGQGTQYINMTKDLYIREPIFREEFDRCCDLIKKYGLNYDLKSLIYPEESTEEAVRKINQTFNAQMCIFVIEYCMANYLMKLGCKPDALIGHSVGEYAAACVAGVFTLEDGLQLIAKRAELMQKVEPGEMLAVSISIAEAKKLLEDIEGIDIAVNNTPKVCVLSGSFKATEALKQVLDKKDIEYRVLKTSHAFHSSMMEPILEEFGHIFDNIILHKPEIPYISNYTGTWIKEEEATSVTYWKNHLRNMVRFADGIETLLSETDVTSVFVEVGPSKTLANFAKYCKAESKKCLNIIRHVKEQQNDYSYLTNVIGKLWEFGEPIDWHCYHHGSIYPKVSLPTYPFKGQKYDISCKEEETEAKSKKEAYENWFYRPAYQITKSKSTSHKNGKQTCLVFTNREQLNHKVISELEEEYTCTYCLMGTGFLQNDTMIEINPESPKDYNRLIETLATENRVPEKILYLWEANERMQSEIKRSIAFAYPLYLIQALGELTLEHKVQIYFITSDGFQVIEDEAILDPMASLLTSFCKMVRKEYDQISCKGIDVKNYLEEGEEVVTAILGEMSNSREDDLVYYRNKLRFTESYEQIPYNSVTREAGKELKQDGIYLITGGLGDLAFETATYLIEQYNATVILTTRDDMPMKEALETCGLSDQISDNKIQKYRRIYQMLEEGAKIVVKKVELTDILSMEEAVKECEQEVGAIQGVFHVAGKEGNGMLQTKSIQKANEVLDPKVTATLVLDQVFANRTLDFFVVYSSMATVYGEAGQVDYISANSFLNSYILWAKEEYPQRKSISINWDNWSDVGMAARAIEQQSNISVFFQNGISNSEAMKALEDILSSNESIVYVAVNEIAEHKKFLQDALEKLKNSLFLTTDGIKYQRPDLAEEYVEPRTEKEKEIAEIWKRVFSIDKVGINDNYFELGGDSIYAITITAQLKKNYQIDLSDIFSYPTIALLANHIEAEANSLEINFDRAATVLEHYNERYDIEDDLLQKLKEYQLSNQKYETGDYSEKKKFDHILLLGVTGFLGIYLLRELLLQSEAIIHMIVRGNEQRVYDRVQSYFGDEFLQQYKDRLKVYVGEIAKPLFGLEMDTYKVLQNQITCIINSSGKVDHYGKYEEFYKSNVAPVKHIIEFAETGVKKEIHQMSTKGVAMGYIEGKDSVLFTEDDVDFGQEFTNLYTSTKHRAENLLLDTRESGIDVSLYRIGDIVFDRANGRFQENMEKNAIYLMVRAMFQFDCIPDGQIDFLEFTAVDFVSKAIVALVMTKSLRNETYHLLNSNRIGFKEWKEVFEVCDKKKKEVSVKEYLQYLKENYEQPKLQHYIQDFLTHTHVLEAHNYTNFIMLQERTDKILEKLHMKWTKPTKEQLIMMMQYGLAQNFFEPKDEFR